MCVILYIFAIVIRHKTLIFTMTYVVTGKFGQQCGKIETQTFIQDVSRHFILIVNEYLVYWVYYSVAAIGIKDCIFFPHSAKLRRGNYSYVQMVEQFYVVRQFTFVVVYKYIGSLSSAQRLCHLHQPTEHCLEIVVAVVAGNHIFIY